MNHFKFNKEEFDKIYNTIKVSDNYLIKNYAPKSRLYLNKNIVIEGEQKMPNLWWRMWHWVLLGWKWEKIE